MIFPEEGFVSPVIILERVDLPQPDSPRSPRISPFPTKKLTSLTAVKYSSRCQKCVLFSNSFEDLEDWK